MAERLRLAFTRGFFTGKAVVLGPTGIICARAQVQAHCSDSQQTARFLAATAPDSGDWLLALPIENGQIQRTYTSTPRHITTCEYVL